MRVSRGPALRLQDPRQGATPSRRCGAGRLLAAGLLALALLAGCEAGYYWQAAKGQWQIIHRRRPIPEVLADDSVPAGVKRKLGLVLAVQDFGVRALALPAGGRYTTYADLDRPHVSWLVVAAPPFELRALEHCFLVAGCFDYRGYFARADAEAYAQSLRAGGYDVRVRPVQAYSTLGWFEDPVLNTFLRGNDLQVMATILHEQAHRVVWAEGDTAFNESFARFVEAEGLRRYLDGLGGRGERMMQRYRTWQADRRRFLDLLRRWKRRLEALYASDRPREAKHQARARLFLGLREDYQKRRASFSMANYDAFFRPPLNNAHLVSVSLYTSRVAAFRALFARHGGEFAPFYEAARRLASMDAAARQRRLERLEHGDAAAQAGDPP